jgi:hypothetical protein
MGWFEYGPLDGDDGMDLQDFIFDILNIRYDDFGKLIQDDNTIRVLLENNQDLLYESLKNYNYNEHLNPGFIQSVYIQALAHIMCEYNAKINDRGKNTFIKFIDSDKWSLENNERKIAMNNLKNRVLSN